MSASRRAWTESDYERAMAYKGRVSSGTASRLTGIPKTTLKAWWSGESGPMSAYRAKQRAGEYSPPPVPPRVSRQRTLQRRAEASRRWYYRSSQHRRFHPRWNPDPELAPLHCLWLRSSDVLAFVRGRIPEGEVLPQLDRDGGSRRRWQEMTNGHKTWLRLDAADTLLTRLGLVLSEMPVDPTYSTMTPRENA